MDTTIKILVVDDSVTMRQTLELILGRHYIVETAQDGEQGIELFHAFQPDIILLDINMPIVDGFGVIEHIRNIANDQDVFILMLTAEEYENFKPKALNLGANDFLFKPFDRTELIARVGVAERQVTLNRRLRGYVRKTSKELELVASLQNKLLPQASPFFEKARISTVYRPSGQASGDYYDYFSVGEGALRVVIADVSGHGARAAFLMAIVRTLFRITTTYFMDLQETLTLVNTHLCQIIGKEPDFVTAFAADIDFHRNIMDYTNCGHCPGMLKSADGTITKLSSLYPMLGFFDQHFVPGSVSFETGSELFLFTDGFYEWEPTPGNFLDLDRFWDLAEDSIRQEGPFLDILMNKLDSLAQEQTRFRDDLTALWVKTG